MPMDKKIKRRWLRALRSGKYTQCQGSLHLKDDGFCCLGVLCDVLKKDFKNVDWEDSGYFRYGDSNEEECRFFGCQGLLPKEIAKRSKLESRDPEVIIGKDEDGYYKLMPLSKLNDEGKPFKEIADLIAKSL